MSGWIKIDRNLCNHWLWKDPQKLYWWLDLLFLANWEDRKEIVGNTIVEVNRGQLLASHQFLSKRWLVSVDTVRKYLRLLQSDDMIAQDVYPKYKLITISNYEKYQETANPSANPSNNPNTDPNAYPSKEYKEGEEVNNNIPPVVPPTDDAKPKRTRKPFVIPTPAEVQAYCDERNNGISGQAFCDHYEAKGWLIGRSPMKDWKSAVRTWEAKRKQGQPTLQPLSATATHTDPSNPLAVPSELERARANFKF